VDKHAKPVIGLCGGIGAGKSLVASELERLGCLVIASDRLNHQILRRPEIVRTLREWWGDRILDDAGAVDRAEIAKIVFAAPKEKGRLESLVYPLIAQEREAMIKSVEDSSAIKAIVIDSPLLFESNLDRECDSIVFVDASEQQRLQRLRNERGWDAGELRRREACQMSLDEKRRRADFVIDNGGPLDDLSPRVADILEKIVGRHP
jgi:dephospho-CoA kinase